MSPLLHLEAQERECGVKVLHRYIESTCVSCLISFPIFDGFQNKRLQFKTLKRKDIKSTFKYWN